jgi:hypothetical protein
VAHEAGGEEVAQAIEVARGEQLLVEAPYEVGGLV